MTFATRDQNTARKVASLLLEIQAVKLNLQHPFIWASGWKSPIYCDNRKSLGYPKIRTFIKNSLAERIQLKFPDCQAIAGVATAGIPQGALVADILNLPFLYVRSKPKGHGLENLIEGHYQSNQRVVLVEDLISTGGSSLRAVEALRNVDVEVLGLASIFNYGFDIAIKNFEDANVPWFSLSNYQHLIDYAAETGIVTRTQLETLEAWRKQPSAWSAG
ncbi:MAG: orotate phosphoribosyltransferase [Cyclobacteriaceae bacterium]|nr:MAG: orotate phosphoribosyltransferase [Cyclobacteriaceae bacterium]